MLFLVELMTRPFLKQKLMKTIQILLAGFSAAGPARRSVVVVSAQVYADHEPLSGL